MTLEDSLNLTTQLALPGEVLEITLKNGQWNVRSGVVWASGYVFAETVDAFNRAKLEQLKFYAPKER